jgi:hypothetical protein
MRGGWEVSSRTIESRGAMDDPGMVWDADISTEKEGARADRAEISA